MTSSDWTSAILPGTLIVRRSDNQVRLIVQCSIVVYPKNWIELRILCVGHNVKEFSMESYTFERTWQILTTSTH